MPSTDPTSSTFGLDGRLPTYDGVQADSAPNARTTAPNTEIRPATLRVPIDIPGLPPETSYSVARYAGSPRWDKQINRTSFLAGRPGARSPRPAHPRPAVRVIDSGLLPVLFLSQGICASREKGVP